MTVQRLLAPQFLNHLIAEDDSIPYTLVAPLEYYSAILGGVVSVPIGFVTDLASIPQIFQSLIPKEGKYNRPAVVHDYLYGLGAYQGKPITRKTADRVLLEAMHAALVDGDRAEVIYLGVRVGGWLAWRRYRHA